MFTPQDIEALHSRGITTEEAENQLQRLQQAYEPQWIVRAASLGDGIAQYTEAEWQQFETLSSWKQSFARFIPASGAATRMFQDLLSVGSTADKDEASEIDPLHQKFLENLAGSALGSLDDATAESADRIHALLSRDAEHLPAKPKALIPFHLEDGEPRTALEQHISEALQTSPENSLQLHFTIPPAHQKAFLEVCDAFLRSLSESDASRIKISTSTQSPATDSLALDSRGNLLRDIDGQLHFRPAGHGALLPNLDELNAHYVFIKNIDNIGPQATQVHAAQWARRLLGLLVSVEQQVHQALIGLHQRDVDPQLLLQLQSIFRWTDPATNADSLDYEAWIRRLNRPLRVAGMVSNTGEPGGGPFWVDSKDPRNEGVSLQIIEKAELDLSNPLQAERFSQGQYFNPVFMALSKRTFRGESFALRRYVDTLTELHVEKSMNGVKVKSIEKPGLWNGSMARWNSIFVEIPSSLFHPVKTVWDLFKPPHQSV